jgi:hypothetical protein
MALGEDNVKIIPVSPRQHGRDRLCPINAGKILDRIIGR